MLKMVCVIIITTGDIVSTQCYDYTNNKAAVANPQSKVSHSKPPINIAGKPLDLAIPTPPEPVPPPK